MDGRQKGAFDCISPPAGTNRAVPLTPAGDSGSGRPGLCTPGWTPQRPGGDTRNPFLCGWSRESGPKSLPGDSPGHKGDVVSPSVRSCLSSHSTQRLRRWQRLGREAGRQTRAGHGAGVAGSGSERQSRDAEEVAVGSGEQGPGAGAGAETRAPSLRSGALGPLPWRTPLLPPSSAQPPEQRVWKQGRGPGVEVARGRRRGQGGRLP